MELDAPSSNVNHTGSSETPWRDAAASDPSEANAPSLTNAPTPSFDGAPPDQMCIRLKQLDEQIIEVEADRSISVLDFRKLVERVTQIPVDRQRLIYRGKLLKDGTLLSAYNVQDGHTVHLVTKPAVSRSAPAAAPESRSSTSEASESDLGLRPGGIPPRSASGVEDNGLMPATTSRYRERLRQLMAMRSAANDPRVSIQQAQASDNSTPTAPPDGTLDHLYQGVLTLRTVLSTAAIPSASTENNFTAVEEAHQGDVDVRSHEQGESDEPNSRASPRYQRSRRRFFVGQWLDVKDTVNQWLECTVMDISEDKILVHYHGWPTRWDEWIDSDSDRIAAFRTRTSHAGSIDQFSPVPTVRVPNAPNVGSNDIRSFVPQLRDVMRDILPHVERLAQLCEDHGQPLELQENVQDELASTTETEDLSEVAHLIAPLFDRFGRILSDTARQMQSLLSNGVQHRVNTSREASRNDSGNARETSSLNNPSLSPNESNLSRDETSLVHDTSLSMRDLIRTTRREDADGRPRRSIDVHIHAIVSPSSLSSLASLARVANSAASGILGSNTSEPSSASPSGRTIDPFGIPSLRPPVTHTRDGRSLVSDFPDGGDHGTDDSRTPLLSSFRRRREPTTFRRQDDRDSDDEMEFSRPLTWSQPRLPSISRMSSRDSSHHTQAENQRDSENANTPVTLGMIPEIVEAEARERDRQQQRDHSESMRLPGQSSEGHESASINEDHETSPSRSSSSFPTFLEVLRRTISGVRNLGAPSNSENPSTESRYESPAPNSSTTETVRRWSGSSSHSSSSSGSVSSPLPSFASFIRRSNPSDSALQRSSREISQSSSAESVEEDLDTVD